MNNNMELLIKEIQKYNNDIDGVEFLRDLVNWLNFRNEHLNSNKTPLFLMKEFINDMK